VTGGGRAIRLKLESIAAAGRAGAAGKVVALVGGERVSEVTYVAERDRPETAVGDEPEEMPLVDSEPPAVEIDDSEDMPGPVDELDLFA
jgi:hypothetical protein